MMTVSWGAMGELWGKDSVTVYIRPQRYTEEFMNAFDHFTLSFFSLDKKQARGFGAMLTIQLESKEFALAILEKVRMIRFAESLGGVETLVTYPTTQTHADVPKEIRERNGITESTLRFSVGIENIEDLIGELEKVFAEIEEEKNDGKKS